MEDNPSDAELCIRKLNSSGLKVEASLARASDDFMEHVRSHTYDLILADYRLPDWNGMDAFKWVRSSGRDIPFVLITGTLGDEVAIECIKAGVSDYVLKDNLERLPVAVRRALEEQKLRQARDQAEKELRESEEQYRLLFHANPHPMWVFDSVTLRFLTVNQAAIHHYGYSLQEFLSMTVKDIRPGEDVDRFLKSVGPRVDAGESYSQLWRHKKKDGTIIDVEISSQPITFGHAQAQLVLAHDVTAQRRVEAEIRESREQLQLLLDSTAEAIYAIDLNGACTLCNAACLRMLGYGHESELLGKDMHTTIHHTRPDGRPYPVAECKIYQAFRVGKRGHVTDEVLWRADGTSFPAEYWSYPIRHDERIVGSVVTFLDITERKKAEEQLRRSESRYRSISESAPYGIFRVDQNGHIAMANPALAAMLGYQTPHEVLGLDTGKDVYLTPTEQQRARDYASEDPKVGHEAKWKRRDGKTLTVRLGGRRLPDDDELPGGFEVFVEDITEQRSLQKQFEHAQKMEAVGRLAGGVAHDFNNLLMVISGYAQLMEDPQTDPRKLSDYLTQIREASSRAASITRQLLAFSRKQVLEPTIIDLNSVVKDLGKMLPRLLGEDVEIATKFDPNLGMVRADRGQLEQVIMNLAVNARDAMPKGGRLTIETANVTLDTAYHQRREVSVPPGRYVLLAVSDTGVGMDAETQLRIFEPFFSTKEEGKGTGLGLATVYGIVKQSNGFIWVYSDLGKGSTFKIYLPRLDVAVTEPSSQPSQATPGGTETILLTEDEDALRNVSRVYLESKGYTVLGAANANEALEFCKSYQKRIHVLITDVVMPGLGGFELAKSALELRPGLSVVLVSGYTDRALDTDAASIGAKFLQKPFSLDALARTVRFLLSRSRKILIIDDSQFMRIAIDRILTAAGYIVKTAGDGDEGLRMAREMKPDLILLDMLLPKAPGPEVLRTLKKDPATSIIPVVVLTVLSEKNKKKLLSQGAAAYLEKSDKLLENDAAILIATVARVLDRTVA
ncbi:MAG TPA: response regulator [Terriglobales bacterium]|nr:response regulator [Terriglobales bacterium]